MRSCSEVLDGRDFQGNAVRLSAAIWVFSRLIGEERLLKSGGRTSMSKDAETIKNGNYLVNGFILVRKEVRL